MSTSSDDELFDEVPAHDTMQPERLGWKCEWLREGKACGEQIPFPDMKVVRDAKKNNASYVTMKC